ncbi:MAG: sigma factor-like helix-turn-helix DNA-binding protein [Candidatus Gracilibacteria bacterium]|nr:sigma factor-like helix-turn-helix DNA-binding protein [Candidatus Gracilibacteria bacterium]
MTTQVLSNKNIVKSFSDILDSLSMKEKNVIERRVGLFSEKETLQNIGNSFKPQITRERVRQIEESGIKKIGRIIKSTILKDVQDVANKYLELNGGIISRDKVISIIIKELELEKNVNSGILEAIIQSDYDIKKSKQRLGSKIYFSMPYIDKKIIDQVHKEALKILKKKKDVMKKISLYETISENIKSKDKLSISFINSVLDLFEDIVFGEEELIGLTKWKILNPKTLKDKAIYIMKREKVPMHFIDLSNKITDLLGKTVKVNTIHNELIRNNEFVLIGRGIYALKEWGFIPGTVLDVIANILEKKGEPMSTEDLTKEVLKTRNVKPTTIYMNLQNKNLIERVGRNYYQFKKQKTS